MKEMIERYKNQLAVAIILLSSLYIIYNFPNDNQYFKGADEGNYYRQAKILVENGLAGFNNMSEVYINTSALQDAPHPLRIIAISCTAIFIFIHDSFHSISLFCLLNFILLLYGTFRFVNRYWGSSVAILTILLMASSPIEMAMARRALMDMPAFTGMAFSCFAFWLWMDTGKRKYLGALVPLMVWSILLKESNVMLLPFFGLTALYLKWKSKTTISLAEIIVGIASPAILTVLLYIFVLGFHNFFGVLNALNKAASNSQYAALWGQGPWYRILVDYIMLSPLVIILAVAFVGYQFLQGNKDKHLGYFLALSIYLLMFLGVLPKNIRYAILLDLPIRLFAANALLLIFNLLLEKKPPWIAAAGLLFLVSVDIKSFHTYFILNSIYDPISYNLMQTNRIIPPINYSNTTCSSFVPSDAVVNAKNNLQVNPTAENFITLGFVYYNEGQFLECILANKEAIRLKPANAVSYNNICAAYINLKDWNHAIEACTESVKIDPAFQLAKNNLDWAKNQAAAEKNKP